MIPYRLNPRDGAASKVDVHIDGTVGRFRYPNRGIGFVIVIQRHPLEDYRFPLNLGNT